MNFSSQALAGHITVKDWSYHTGYVDFSAMGMKLLFYVNMMINYCSDMQDLPIYCRED